MVETFNRCVRGVLYIAVDSIKAAKAVSLAKYQKGNRVFVQTMDSYESSSVKLCYAMAPAPTVASVSSHATFHRGHWAAERGPVIK